jgi:hypothetical protein
MSVTTEKSLRVYNDKEGVSIVVRIAPDGPEFGIEIATTDEPSAAWFGPQRLQLTDKDYAEALGAAILEMAKDIQ